MMTKLPVSTVLGLAGWLLCAAAQGASFSFSGSTDSGPLTGAAFSGQYSFSATGLPTDGEVALTAFTLAFAGQTYTLASASAAPTAVFVGGSFAGLSYVDDQSTNTALRPQVSLTPGFFGLSDAYLAYVGSGGAGGFGSYTISAVPEPAAIALWLGGLLAVGAAARRRR